MVNLYFQPDAALTPQDRMVLDVLQKDYNRYEKETSTAQLDASEDSDDSAVKRTQFVAPSPEGMPSSASSTRINTRSNAE